MRPHHVEVVAPASVAVLAVVEWLLVLPLVVLLAVEEQSSVGRLLTAMM
jgi:hypothetical protein